jgi:hypothetical protein
MPPQKLLTRIRYIKDYPESSFTSIWEFVGPRVRASRATLDRYKTDGIYACRLAGSGLSPVLF